MQNTSTCGRQSSTSFRPSNTSFLHFFNLSVPRFPFHSVLSLLVSATIVEFVFCGRRSSVRSFSATFLFVVSFRGTFAMLVLPLAMLLLLTDLFSTSFESVTALASRLNVFAIYSFFRFLSFSCSIAKRCLGAAVPELRRSTILPFALVCIRQTRSLLAAHAHCLLTLRLRSCPAVVTKPSSRQFATASFLRLPSSPLVSLRFVTLRASLRAG